jgi:hypothetical protein
MTSMEDWTEISIVDSHVPHPAARRHTEMNNFNQEL